MKLLFIENRYKTFFFDAIAKKLTEKGYTIHWIIQNHEFLPNAKSTKHVIPYPKGVYEYTPDNEISKIIEGDRQINHFNKKDISYFYYYNQKIKEIVETIKPDVIFGEATAFHELLVVKNARELKIPFLNPTTSRYPVGRFAFYQYDTLEPFMGSGEVYTNTEAKKVIDSIVHKQVVPDYMKKRATSQTKIFKDIFLKSKSYLSGEKYNTPHPIVKYKVEQKKKKNISTWNALAVTKIDDNKFKVLYPLQMQPEANLDVWGRKHRDQTLLVKKIIANLSSDTILYIKPNPKSKYELSPSLIKLINQTPNIIALHHSCTMEEVFPKIDMVITVTGTIAIESILANKPVLTLAKTLNNQAKNAIYLANCSEIATYETQVKEGTFPKISESEKIDFINLLNKTSFSGIISDPYSDPKSISKENIDLLVGHFEFVLEKIYTEVNQCQSLFLLIKFTIILIMVSFSSALLIT